MSATIIPELHGASGVAVPLDTALYVPAHSAIESMRQHMLVDGFDHIIDFERSHGSYMVEARSGKQYLDLFTCIASMPLGMNHPKLNNEEFIKYIGKVALHKPSNSDIYSEEMATFVKTFFEIAVPKAFKYAFFIEGGALAVENALKVAFDWKVQKNFLKGYKTERGHKIIHFRRAFHGRSGYTMSLTNTDPSKYALFPKFEWPRIHNPAMTFPLTEENLLHVMREEEEALNQIKQAFSTNRDDIAAIIIEPIQGEGGDNHFRREFLQELRNLCDENEALLIFDEVQTGLGLTGAMWAHEAIGVTPDVMSFGKKTQVCGIIATGRIDDIDTHVFRKSSRINSTWGGNIVDMVRVTKYLEIIRDEQLLSHVQTVGEYLKTKLNSMREEFPALVSNVRGRGLFSAFTLPTSDMKNQFLHHAYHDGLLLVGSGESSIRFRPPLNLTTGQVDEGVEIMSGILKKIQEQEPQHS
jgi:L-lysine 6-transaminase